MNALCTCLFGHAASTSTVLLPEFDSRHYLKAIARFKCSWITSVPTMLAMAFMEEDLVNSLDLSSVSIVRMGSAPVSPKLWQRVEEIFPGANIMNGYGTTEAGPMVFSATGGKPVPPMSVGRKVAEVDVKLIDEDGNEADQGVCWQRTPANTLGYLNLPDKSAEVITADGWYDSGDVFRRDAEGNYYFVGRDDDMFVCGGENIYPGQVEGILVGHEGVEQSCVVPVPDDIKGEKPIAFVVRSFGSTVTEDEVKQHALANAPAFQHPRMVIFMDELPLAGPGKIDRKGLEAQGREIWQAKEAKT
jgi:acyl-CoA synthetase (AMP-forming)/AMP-acid ligase II